MDDKDRRELERLLDLQEKEQLLEGAPVQVLPAPALEERRAMVAELKRQHDAERAHRESRREPDTEWIE